MLQKHAGLVSFHFQDGVSIRLKKRQKLKEFLRKLAKNEQYNLHSLVVIFCSDKTLLGINREFLHHDYYTDIITFNLGDKPAKYIQGEIYISVDRVKENAQQLSQPVQTELHRVIFHGVLHLCGYKDKNASQIRTMRKAEAKYLELYFQ